MAMILLSWSVWRYVILGALAFVILLQVLALSAEKDIVEDLADDGILNDSEKD